MLPTGFEKVIESFTNVIAKMTNPFVPLIFMNVIVDFFTFMIFLFYRSIWIWTPGAILLVFTMIMYGIFAVKSPHMLSSTTIQKFGMQLAAGLGQKGKEITEQQLEELPLLVEPKRIGIPNKDKK